MTKTRDAVVNSDLWIALIELGNDSIGFGYSVAYLLPGNKHVEQNGMKLDSDVVYLQRCKWQMPDRDFYPFRDELEEAVGLNRIDAIRRVSGKFRNT